MSDWSTDSCGWSDEDYGVDLDFTTPPLSVDSGAVDTSDQEIVRCICEVEEENDFMIQVSCWLGLHDNEKTLHRIYIGYIHLRIIWFVFKKSHAIFGGEIFRTAFNLCCVYIAYITTVRSVTLSFFKHDLGVNCN